MGKRESKALIGRQEIMEHLGIGKHRFYELVAAGLPVKKRGVTGGVWSGHKEEVDNWFRVGGG